MNRADRYRRYFTKECLMGPNSFRLLDELIRRNPYDTCYDREDESAIFIKNGKAEIIGIIHRIEKGEIRPFTEKDVRF